MSNWFNENDFNKNNAEEKKQATQDALPQVSPYLQFKDVVHGTIEDIKAFNSSKKGTPGIEVVFVENEETPNLRYNKDYPYKNRRYSTRQFYLTPKTLVETMYYSPLRYFASIFKELGQLDKFTEAFSEHPKNMDVDDVIEILQDTIVGTEFCTVIGGEQYYRAKDGELVTKGVLNVSIPGMPCNEESTKFLNEFAENSSWKILQKPDSPAPAADSNPEVENTTDNDVNDDDIPF